MSDTFTPLDALCGFRLFASPHPTLSLKKSPPGSNSRSLDRLHRCIATEDPPMPHVDLPIMEPAENVKETGAISSTCASRDHGRQDPAGTGASLVSRLDALTIPSHPVRSSVSFPDLPVYPNTHVRTNECLIPDEIISRIEEITVQEGGAKFADHLTEDAAQFFVDVVHEVRPHVLSLPGSCLSPVCSRSISEISPSRL